MPSRTRPYELFGPYILFRKLESDALGDLWRAARLDDRHLGPLVALRRLTGGNREALVQAASEAKNVAPLLTETSIVKNQVIETVDGVPCVTHEYDGGRSLRYIIDRARGGNGATPNPMALDQAILIAERLALSLATLSELRYSGNRLLHGALIPQFVWVSEDGEVRVAGQQLGRGLAASLKDGKVGGEIGRYFSLEYQQTGEATPASEVYALGALLFLLVTGVEPPDAAATSAFAHAVRGAKTMAGNPIPDDIRAVLDKSLVIDPSRRYPAVADMKQALSALAHGGKYSATTFNLAFYLNNLLKKEMEAETVDREKESKVNIAPYLEQRVAAPAAPFVALAPPAKRNKSAVYALVAIVALVLGVGGFMLFKGMTPKANAQITSPTRQPAPPPKPAVVVQPAPMTETAPPPTAPTATMDPAAQKKAFEEAVNQKLKEEMRKLQTQFNSNPAPQEKPKPVTVSQPVLTASVAPQKTTVVTDERAPSAAALDERRVASRQEPAAVQPPPQPQPQTVLTPPPASQPEPQPQPVAPAGVREGDVVNYEQLDVKPVALSKPRLVYPPMAKRQRVETSLIMAVLVSENGDVTDVKVLRGDPRFGFNEEATRALQTVKFRPAMKDGKRVKTLVPVPIEFKMTP